MRKLIICYNILFLIICSVVIILVCKHETNMVELNNKLLSIDIENIIAVRIREETEGGYFYYKTEEKPIIYKIYNALNNVKIGREADINVVDDSREYIFDLKDGTEKIFSFHSNFYYTNYITYETQKYKELRRIEIPRTESWE